MLRHAIVHRSPGYVCPFCPDREHKYTRPDSLHRHVRVHHVDKDRHDPALREVLAQRTILDEQHVTAHWALSDESSAETDEQQRQRKRSDSVPSWGNNLPRIEDLEVLDDHRVNTSRLGPDFDRPSNIVAGHDLFDGFFFRDGDTKESSVPTEAPAQEEEEAKNLLPTASALTDVDRANPEAYEDEHNPLDVPGPTTVPPLSRTAASEHSKSTGTQLPGAAMPADTPQADPDLGPFWTEAQTNQDKTIGDKPKTQRSRQLLSCTQCRRRKVKVSTIPAYLSAIPKIIHI
jgi:hypothetical protein